MLYFDFVPSPEKVSHAKFFPEREGRRTKWNRHYNIKDFIGKSTIVLLTVLLAFVPCLSLTRSPVGAFIGNAMQNTENARRFVHLARTRRILSACVAEQERSEILSRLEACLNSQAGSPDFRQRGDYMRHLSYLRNEQFLAPVLAVILLRDF